MRIPPFWVALLVLHLVGAVCVVGITLLLAWAVGASGATALKAVGVAYGSYALVCGFVSVMQVFR